MQFDGALVREQGVTFAVISVKSHVVDHVGEAQDVAGSFRHVFPGVPIILMSQDAYGRATYRGRRDIVNFLTSVSPNRLPWRRYSI